jgi:hypothetical protein
MIGAFSIRMRRERRDTMFGKHTLALIPLLALIALFSLLSGCGAHTSGQARSAPSTPLSSGKLPDSVQITFSGPSIAQATPPPLTLHARAQVQKLYQTMLTLPSMPLNTGCPAIGGPSYQLVFRSGTQTLVQVEANSGGCGTVTLPGEKQDRLASQFFWTQLHQAIVAATPVPKLQALAIQHTLPGNRPVLTARITNAAIAQRLYNTLLAQPVVSNPTCSNARYPTYQMVFQAASQFIVATISQQCKTTSLNSHYQPYGAFYSLTAHFQQVFAQSLASAKFASAQPDQLLKEIEMDNGAVVQGQVTNLSIVRQLYSTIFTLQARSIGPDCPSEADKINHTATLYTLHFRQWNLPIMDLSIYKGTCQLINPSPQIATGQTLRGDTTFWNLLKQVS